MAVAILSGFIALAQATAGAKGNVEGGWGVFLVAYAFDLACIVALIKWVLI